MRATRKCDIFFFFLKPSYRSLCFRERGIEVFFWSRMLRVFTALCFPKYADDVDVDCRVERKVFLYIKTFGILIDG